MCFANSWVKSVLAEWPQASQASEWQQWGAEIVAWNCTVET